MSSDSETNSNHHNQQPFEHEAVQFETNESSKEQNTSSEDKAFEDDLDLNQEVPKKDNSRNLSKEPVRKPKNQDINEVDKVREKNEKISEKKTHNGEIPFTTTKQKVDQGKHTKEKEMQDEIDTEKQTAFENMWNRAIQESQQTNNTPKSKSSNGRSNAGLNKSRNKSSNKYEASPENPSSITKRFLRHIFQAILDLTHTNHTAFAINLLWHSTAVYYLALRPRKALLTNAVVAGGISGVPNFAVDTVKFLGGIHAAWALLSLLSFKIRDTSAQKAILLAFTLANFSHLYFNVSALASGRWKIWFTKITAGSSIVTLVNIACYLASVKKNGRYL